MASALWRGSFPGSTSRGASQPAEEHRGALRGAVERAEAAASSSSMLPGRAQSNRSAAQPSPSTQQDIGPQEDDDANSIAAQPGAAPTARNRESTPSEGSLWELIRVIYRIRYVSGSVMCFFAQWRIIGRTRAGQDPEIFCHHISKFLIAPRSCPYLDSHIAKLIRVARASSPGWLAPIAEPTYDPRRSSPSSLVRMLKKADRKRRFARRARQLLGRIEHSACHTSLR